MEKKQRIAYLDNLRLLAMSMILYGHLSSVMLGNGSLLSAGSLDWELTRLLRDPGPSGVTLFFMISGFLILSSDKTTDIRVLLGKRLPRLIVPLIAWTFVAALRTSQLAHDYTVSGALLRFWNGLLEPIQTHYWFMFSLIALYLFSPVISAGLRHLDQKGHAFVFSLLLAMTLCGVIDQLLPDQIRRLLHFSILDRLQLNGGEISCFLLGWYLGNMKKRVPNWVLYPAAGLFTLILILCNRSFLLQNGGSETPYMNSTQGLTVGLAICLFLLFKQNSEKRWRFLNTVPVIPLTYPIYYLHVMTMELIFGLGWTPRSFAGALFFTAVNFTLCFMLTKTAASIKPLCYPSAGLSFEEACASCNWQFTFRKTKKHAAL